MTLWMLPLLATLAFADAEIPSAWNPCEERYCPPEMASIAQEFQTAGRPERSEMPLVASGSCFHDGAEFNPEVRHYGALLLDQKEEQSYMGGSFGFFYSENPYSEWTVESARKATPRLYDDSHRVTFRKDFAYANMSGEAKDPDKRIEYWLRQSEREILLVGVWGSSHVMVCKYRIHE